MTKRIEQARLAGRFQHIERACGFEIFIIDDALQSMAVLPEKNFCERLPVGQNIVWSSPSI